MARLLIITAHFPPDIGGIQNMCFDLYKILSRDHEVHVLTRGFEASEQDPNVHRIGRMGLPMFNIRSIFPMIGLIRKKGIDLVLSGSLNTGFAAGLAASIMNIRCASLAHGLDILYPNPLYRLALKMAFSQLDLVSANSRNTKRLLATAGYDKKRIRVIHPTLPEKHVDLTRTHNFDTQAIREKLGLSNKPVLLSVGRLAPRKGLLPFVTRSFPLILKEFPDCQLVIVGDSMRSDRKASELSRIMTAAANLGIEGNIKVPGHVEDDELLAIYHACDLFIFPVQDIPWDVEGFGIVALEAALAGKPSLGTRTGGIPDAILDGATGRLVDPGDHEAFARAALEMLSDKRQMREFGAAGQKRALEEFSVGALEPAWEGFITEVLAGQGIDPEK